jgi:hypothetical protein
MASSGAVGSNKVHRPGNVEKQNEVQAWINAIGEFANERDQEDRSERCLFDKEGYLRHLECTSLEGARERLKEFVAESKRLKPATDRAWAKANKNVTRISGHIHVELLRKYLPDGYPDTQLPTDILNGFDLTGVIAPSGLWGQADEKKRGKKLVDLKQLTKEAKGKLESEPRCPTWQEESIRRNVRDQFKEETLTKFLTRVEPDEISRMMSAGCDVSITDNFGAVQGMIVSNNGASRLLRSTR